ncbi:hypothetical protein SAMN02745116_02228 [Pilibacter termitis]|uniref:Uncharacterized protein n=1 Tax=Pilibacter termitis TaxID=263852 RepID=A0A1T4QKP9_9ENTE|nr:hypothetical protein [Pilibacter termitis]SKA04285.1 hypothetical protein SAMN02745116_02228 [Pilibacter termitis]
MSRVVKVSEEYVAISYKDRIKKIPREYFGGVDISVGDIVEIKKNGREFTIYPSYDGMDFATEPYISTKKIVFWFILFYPVGFYLLYKRNRKSKYDRKEVAKNGKTFFTVSCVLLVFAGLGFFSCIANGEFSTAFSALVYFVPAGLFLNYKGSNMIAEGKRYDAYYTLVVGQEESLLRELSLATGYTKETIREDLERMIELKIFERGTYLDERIGEIVLPNRKSFATREKERLATAVFHTVKCPACGASKKIEVGKIDKCDYCQKPIG